jgi:zinc/manganese transport system substrate-binding protein
MVLSNRVGGARALTAVLILASCGAQGQPVAGTMIATTTIWADITSEVACRERVDAIIPPGADPHTFEISLRDRQKLGEASVVVANGGSLGDLLASATSEGTHVVLATDHVDMSNDDPHIWHDPTHVAAALEPIADALVASGRDRGTIDACVAAYRDDLLALDIEITEMFKAVPRRDRLMVTNHDSLSYFAERYDLEIVGTVIPSTNTLASTSASELASLTETITRLGVRAVFTDRVESSRDAEALAERLGIQVIPLLTDSLDDEPPADTYLGLMRSNAQTIVKALAP